MICRMRMILAGIALVCGASAAAPAAADQPPPSSAMSSRDFKAAIEDALHHAYEADAAGSQRDARGLKIHASKALEKAKEAQRAGHNERLNDGVYALGDAIEHAAHDTEDAVEHVKRAIMKLSQSAGLQIPDGAIPGTRAASKPSGSPNGAAAGSGGRMGAYSGGYFDDGFADDDWFFDYYDVQFSPTAPAKTDSASAHRRTYQADQLYENAKTSGLFEF